MVPYYPYLYFYEREEYILLVFLYWLIHVFDKTLGPLNCIFYFILEWIVVVSPEELIRSKKEKIGWTQVRSIRDSVWSIGQQMHPSSLGGPIDQCKCPIDRTGAGTTWKSPDLLRFSFLSRLGFPLWILGLGFLLRLSRQCVCNRIIIATVWCWYVRRHMLETVSNWRFPFSLRSTRLQHLRLCLLHLLHSLTIPCILGGAGCTLLPY